MSAQNVIKHVVLLLMENHSFDQILGCVQSEYPGLDGVDVESQSPRFNLDLAGNKVFQVPTDQQQVELDPKHENRFVLDQITDGNSGATRSWQEF
jgi:phospholipase C